MAAFVHTWGLAFGDGDDVKTSHPEDGFLDVLEVNSFDLINLVWSMDGLKWV